MPRWRCVQWNSCSLVNFYNIIRGWTIWDKSWLYLYFSEGGAGIFCPRWCIYFRPWAIQGGCMVIASNEVCRSGLEMSWRIAYRHEILLQTLSQPGPYGVHPVIWQTGLLNQMPYTMNFKKESATTVDSPRLAFYADPDINLFISFRYIEILFRLAPFESFKNHPGHFNKVVHSTASVKGLIELIQVKSLETRWYNFHLSYSIWKKTPSIKYSDHESLQWQLTTFL